MKEECRKIIKKDFYELIGKKLRHQEKLAEEIILLLRVYNEFPDDAKKTSVEHE